MILAVVFRQSVLNTIQSKLTLVDTVAIATDEGTEIGIVFYLFLFLVITMQHFI